MKMILKPMLLLLFTIMSCLSCNNEELFIESVAEIVVEPETPQEDNANEDTDAEIDFALPCDFDLNTVQTGDTVVINCIMDLEGQSINLPPNVNLVYEGGEITNGTINFSENNVIDGDLLNSTITITGSKPIFKDPVFNFIPNKWGIIEGKVSDEVALNNRNILNNLFDQVKELGISTFKIDEMDAYFKVDVYSINRKEYSSASIQIPSDFHLLMGEDTYLRVQPSAAPSYALISFFLVDNARISGGNLIGDRYEHDYSPVTDDKGVNRDTHEFGTLIYVIGSENIEIEDINLSNPIGDGIMFHSETLRAPDGTLYPGTREVNNVLVKNTTVVEARRNGISFLDGRNIIIDNCEIIDTGRGSQAYDDSEAKIASSSGTWPKYGIDLEAIRTVLPDGTLNRSALIEMITIKNSNFKGNFAGDIALYTCNDVTLEYNTFDSHVGNFAADNITIRNNVFKARLDRDGNPHSRALLLLSRLSSFNEEELNYSYDISNNKIIGYINGMVLSGTDFKVYNNEISNCESGIKIGGLIDAQIHDNKVYSREPYGVALFARGGLVKNVSIYNEYYDVYYRPIDFRGYNDATSVDHDYLKIFDCIFNSAGNRSIYLDNSHYIEFDNLTSNAEIEIVNNSTNIIQN
ncbi:hypothetical protein [Thalassobellus suaedae]|uniref:Right-handed parallel beta-helix repeat-containing protein n=1 Tax=Thalassobellus suaedae TaxID=3074124 RepID=A0ABY9Y2A0_9FLAO|nr:right-handed parallel beta-helix repeat-containing protein [Flavobacteriaceae bacterium HL-DH10]